MLAWVWTLTTLLIVVTCQPPAVPGLVIATTVALLLGDQIRRRGEAQRGLRQQEEISAAEQARRAVLEERTRIARELHDVVAHHMSLIAVRAETAPYRLGEQSAEQHRRVRGHRRPGPAVAGRDAAAARGAAQ